MAPPPLHPFLPVLGAWFLRWGLPLLLVLALQPDAALWARQWVPLHAALEIFAVIVSAMIFMVGRNALMISGSRVGAWVGGLFLFAAIMDMAHLLSFPGMPDWLTRNIESKSTIFWLWGRIATALGLLACVSLDWQRTDLPGVRRWMLPVALAAAAAALAGSLATVDAWPGLFWNGQGLTGLKIGLEGLVIALMGLAIFRAMRGAQDAPYERPGMVTALLTLIAGELCFVAYDHFNDAYVVMGHVYKVAGSFLLYRTLVEGLLREPYRRLALAEAHALRKGTELEALFVSAPDGVMLVDEAGAILKVNPRFTQLTGYESEQIMGLPLDILIPQRFRTAHRKHVQDYMDKPLFRSMGGAGRELYARRRDGSEFPADVSLSSALIDGRRCVIATLRDVSERAALIRRLSESEVRIRSFLDNSVDWVWETDPSGTITYSSHRIADILGYPPEEAVGRSLMSFMAESDALQLGPQIREIVVRREPLLYLQHMNRTREDGMRFMETSARPYYAPDGRFMGYRGVTRDVSQQRQLQQALEKSERIFRHAFDDFPTGMMFVDCYGTVLRVNAFLSRLLGYESGELEKTELSQLFPMEQRRQVAHDILALCDGRVPVSSVDIRMVCKGGPPRWTRLAATLVDTGDGTVGPLLLMISDVAVEKSAASHNARLLAIIERMGDTVAVADRDGRNLYLNPYGRTLLGIGLEEDISGETIRDQHPQATGQFIVNRALPHAEKHGVWEGETLWRSRSGEEIATWQVIMAHKDAGGAVEYWTTVARDIRERKLLEDRLQHQATHDALTGLPNRLLLRDRLQQAIAVAKREGKLLAVVFVDLDNFKRINDTLGHAFGDQVLMEIARRLRECLRESDTLARQGGDEFIAVLPGLSTVGDVVGIIEKMVVALAWVIVIDGREVHVTASVGVSLYPYDHDDGDELLRKADVAMYRAKEHGRNSYQFYTSDMDERFDADLQTEIDLRHAIDNGELLLHYQPKVALVSGEITGFEALVRWQHPWRGMIPPAEFIPVAERSMLIAQLGEWVLREACRQIRSWRQQGGGSLPVAVNVSAQQFEYGDFAHLLRTVLADSALSGEALELEITEGVLMRDPVSTARILTQIRSLGVRIAVDDFGTGYSSLGYLKQFPVDVLKIDRSFVKEVPANADDAAIVRAIMSMAHNLDMQVVAEGVESEAQLAFLRECGCDFGQGYLFAYPMPAAQAAAFETPGPASTALG